MRKRKNLKVQPLKSAKLSEEERQLRLLGLQFGEALRQFEMIRASVVNLERELCLINKIYRKSKCSIQANTEQKIMNPFKKRIFHLSFMDSHLPPHIF